MLRALAISALFALAALPAGASPLRVCATTPSLGSLVREVGADEVEVSVFAKGTEDPHFVEARPSFVKKLSRADLLVQNGMELEVGWLPALLRSARNGRVLPGAPGYLDASAAISPLEIPSGLVDRSMGDVHATGNPHYLLDPLNGLLVAELIRDRLSALRPEQAAAFGARHAAFEQRLRGQLDGWLGSTQPLRGVKAVGDHNLWAYFAQRFGVSMIGFLEPKPGVPPTTAHLQELVAQMRAQGAKLILSAEYYDPAHARFVAETTGARIVAIAHEVGAHEGTGDYVAMIDYNVRQLVGNRDGG